MATKKTPKTSKSTVTFETLYAAVKGVKVDPGGKFTVTDKSADAPPKRFQHVLAVVKAGKVPRDRDGFWALRALVGAGYVKFTPEPKKAAIKTKGVKPGAGAPKEPR